MFLKPRSQALALNHLMTDSLCRLWTSFFVQQVHDTQLVRTMFAVEDADFGMGGPSMSFHARKPHLFAALTDRTIKIYPERPWRRRHTQLPSNHPICENYPIQESDSITSDVAIGSPLNN